jgi:hypothetical protein
MKQDPNSRRVAILWFVAAALSLAAALIGWAADGEIKWVYFAAAVPMAILGATRLRPPNPPAGGAGAESKSGRKSR